MRALLILFGSKVKGHYIGDKWRNSFIVLLANANSGLRKFCIRTEEEILSLLKVEESKVILVIKVIIVIVMRLLQANLLREFFHV